MTLSYQQVVDRICDMHLDDMDIEITRNADGFDINTSSEGLYVSDIGSSFEVPGHVGEHGMDSFTAGPWTAYRYHAAYVRPQHGNFAGHLDDLAAGRVNTVIVGVAAVDEHWVLGIQTKAG
ncbi:MULTISPECIES: hypothetical protein [Mycolicibacter]|uniref:Uncharacterized protein n=1 Tax=Mycolicibacter longobardus TaxID=1108812 RepID=A0A1X1YBT7_9MYCO|nr:MULTISPECIES: hypothetical protein [Mycolicibacter]ORW08460.1 hypothetical protein AWC16_18845 [Mycolicibacter longobardus]RAV04429.1 hypothetical protein DQP56_01020 [Mycolicibacter senuensis]